ncbi:MAG: methionine ABC transporter permease [Gammaproteobacteria bacterium]
MSNATLNLLLLATGQTLYMVLVSGAVAILGGLPLGVLLFTTRKHGILANELWNRGLGMIVNCIRSIPFVILLVALIPLTRLLMGTSIGTNAALVPLSICAIPFVGRLVENALTELYSGLIEAGHSMGASPWQIIRKILLPEALPGIINCITVTLINLVGYSAMAGAVGGGGLGSVAINYGYQRFNPGIMLITIVILIILVQLLQHGGDWLAKKLDHR